MPATIIRRLCYLTALLALAFAGCDDGGTSPGGPAVEGDGGTSDRDTAVPPPPGEIVLTVTSPENDAVVRGPRLEVTGTITGDSGQVRVNDQVARVEAGVFTKEIEVAAGPQTIVVTAADQRVELNITVDPDPPRLEILAPGRGTYSESDQLELRFIAEDDTGLHTLTLNGRDVPTSRGPEFTLPITLSRGLNILMLEAGDRAGNLTREHVAVLHGELQPEDTAVKAAFRVRVGPDGLMAIGRTAARYLDSLDLASFIPGPLESGRFSLGIGQIRHDPSAVEITGENAKLRVHLHLERVSAPIQLSIGDRVFAITVSMQAIDLRAAVIPRVEQGRITLGIEEVVVDFTTFAVDLGDLPPDDRPPDGEGLFELMVQDGLAAAAENLLPDLLDGFLGKLEESIPVTLLGATMIIQLIPDVLVVTVEGLSARVDATVALQDPPMGVPPVAGYLWSVSAWDGVPETAEIGLAVDPGLINLLAYQLYRSGVLFPVIDQAFLRTAGSELSLVSGLLNGLLRTAYPDLAANTPTKIITQLPLPPIANVAAGAEGGADLSFGLGDLAIDIRSDDAEDRALIDGSASLTFTGQLAVSFEGDAPALALEVGEVVGAFDVLTEGLKGTRTETKLEETVTGLLQAVGVMLPGIVQGIPLPALDVVSIASIELGVDGPNGDFLSVIATLAP